MHPAPGTRLYKYLSEFWVIAKRVCGPYGSRYTNDAIKYPFHVTLTSFFRLNDQTKLTELIDIAKTVFKDISSTPVIDSTPYDITPYNVPRGFTHGLNMSGLKLSAPQVTKAIHKLTDKASGYGVKSKVANDLHLTLYNKVNHIIRDSLECSKPPVIRATPWDKVRIILWETNDSYSYWKQVHKF